MTELEIMGLILKDLETTEDIHDSLTRLSEKLGLTEEELLKIYDNN